MRFFLLTLFLSTLLFGNIATVVDSIGSSTLFRAGKSYAVTPKQALQEHDKIVTGEDAKVKIFFQDNTAVSLGKRTTFEIDKYLFDATPKSNVKFSVAKGFFKTVTGRIGKIAPNRFKLKTKNATIGIRGTVFAAYVTAQKDDVFCTDGKIMIFTSAGEVGVDAGKRADVRAGVKPHVVTYTQAQKEEMLKKSGWKSGKSLKELIAYIKANFKEPLRSQLLATIRNILKKDSDSRKVFLPATKKQWENADDIGFIDELTLNGREFDSLNEREIEFYPEDLEDGRVVVKGILESEDAKIPLSSLYVEVSTDGGSTWKRAKGHAEWEFSFTPEFEKTYEFGLRVVQEKTLASPHAADLLVFEELNKDINPAYLNDFDKGVKLNDKSIHSLPAKVITTKPIVVKFKSFGQKVITTEPIVVKFKSFAQKVITTEPIVVKFKSFGQKVITTEPIIVKFKSLGQKVITTDPIIVKFKSFAQKVIATEPIVVKFKATPRDDLKRTVPNVEKDRSKLSPSSDKLDRELPTAKRYKDNKRSSKQQTGGKNPTQKEYRNNGVNFDKKNLPVEHKKVDKEHLPGTHGGNSPSGNLPGNVAIPDAHTGDAHTGVDMNNPGSFDGTSPAGSGMKDGMFGQEAADWESEVGSNHHGWNDMNSQSKYYQMIGAGDVAPHMAGKDTLDWEKKHGFHNSKYMEDTMTNTPVHASSYLKEGEKLSHNSDEDDAPDGETKAADDTSSDGGLTDPEGDDAATDYAHSEDAYDDDPYGFKKDRSGEDEDSSDDSSTDNSDSDQDDDSSTDNSDDSEDESSTDNSDDSNDDKDKDKKKKEKEKKEKQDGDDESSFGQGGEAGGSGNVDPAESGYAPTHMTGKQAAAMEKTKGLMKNGVGYVGGKAGGSGDGRVDNHDKGNGVVVVGGGGQDNPNDDSDDGQLHYSGSSVVGGKVKITKKEQAGGNVHVNDH